MLAAILCILLLLIRLSMALLVCAAIGLALIMVAFIVYYCLVRLIEKKEECVISKAADTFIKEAIREQYPDNEDRNKEVKRSFYYHFVGQYGACDKSCILSRLSNKHVLAFEIKKTALPDKDNLLLFEVYPPSETTDAEHIKAVTPRILHALRKLKVPSNLKLNLLILALLSIGLGILFLLALLIYCLKVYFFALLVVYAVFLWYFTKERGEKTKSSMANIVGRVMTLPLLLAVILLKPTLCILFGCLVWFTTAFVYPIVVVIVLTQGFAIELSWNTIIFLILTLGFIIGVHGSAIVLSEIRRMSSNIIRRKGTRDEEMMENLALYVVQKGTIKFFIYLAYLILISIMAYMKLQYGTPMLSEGIDNAIVTSFLVFIAYTNMVVNSKDVEMSSKELYSKMIKVLFGG